MSLSSIQTLLLQTPLSQLTSVLADIRGLLAPSNSQETGVNPNLARDFEASLPLLLHRFYHEQGKVVRLPGVEGGSIIAKESQDNDVTPSDTNASSGTIAYRDEGKSKRFHLDPLAGTASSADSYTVSNKDQLRVELEQALQSYLREHYPDLDKSRLNEGACGAVWRGPLREVKVTFKARKSAEFEEEQQQQEEEEAAKPDEMMQDALHDPLHDTPVEAVAIEEGGQAASSHGTVEASKDVSEETAAALSPTTMTATTTGPGATVGSSASEASPLPATAIQRAEDLEEDEDEGELVESENGEADRYTIRIVSGKSNAANFWSGRLLSTYIFRPSSSTLTGSLKVQIHYYENGNVQLNTSSSSPVDLPLPASFTDDASGAGAGAVSMTPSQKAKTIIQTIKKYETEYQRGIEETYEGLNDRAFKNLRRQLPVTRQKVDWDKVLNYRLGSDLAGAQQSR